MATTSFSVKQVCAFFFKPLLDEQDEPTCFFRCQCLVVRKQEHKAGYSNLMSHIRQRHPDYAAVMAASGTASGTLAAFVDKKSLTIYSWMDFVVDCGLPFAFPEHATARKYTSLAPICTETLLKYMRMTTEAVEEAVISFLPPKFGIIFDGSTYQSEHYMCLFATFGHDNHTETILLAMAPIIDDGTLQLPIHRLNLVVKAFMNDWETLLDKVQALMCKLRGLNASAMLRKKTELRSVLRQATRWSSTYCMLQRFFKIKEVIDTEDDAIAELMPTKREENKLQQLLEQLKNFESASKKLQSEDGVSLLDVRDLFDELIGLHPALAKSLGAKAKIVKSPVFESACVDVLMGKAKHLSRQQRAALSAFAVDADDEPDQESKKLGFADRALKERKIAREQLKEYPDVQYIPPTSNVCERFFSKTKHTLGYCRTGMLPVHLEMVLFLKANRRFWNSNTVMKVVNAD
ncbi:Hypothetical protein PHPALM_16014 [Phytophthora palmivora]|uniref:HAT C-terminal dimerisation domain-containing protein n=1 Tax=Phytophthora palmivora TaxID=4796 RepID=A0A2P4XQP8_9STRA|nr:Hypothetical protein PHPALM_16014 [Phytophthora palmivora]